MPPVFTDQYFTNWNRFKKIQIKFINSKKTIYGGLCSIMEKKSIDIVKEIIKKKREESERPEEKIGLTKILDLIDKNEFCFLALSPSTVARLFSGLGMEDKQAIELYRDLVSKENRRKYKEYMREQRKNRVVSAINEFFKNKKINREDDDDARGVVK